jgi:autotransporter family porin
VTPTSYVGNGGVVAVDAFLAPAPDGKSDLLTINGTTSGSTDVVVNLTNPIGSSPNNVGIPVITVNGTTHEDDFNLPGGVLNAGFFAWDLQLDGDTHELITTGLGAGSFEFAAGITGAQDIWHLTTGTLLQRQADLRPMIADALVTPVADFAEPVEPTPVSHVTPGFWLKGVGAWLRRDAEEGVLDLDRDQDVYGIFAGFDFGTENLASPGDALLFGLLAGYIYSELDFSSTNTKWEYEGPSVGAYATYLNHALYVDAIVKADFLDIDIDADDLAPGEGDADTDAVNIGGQIDAGYKIDLTGIFLEPQASLAVVHTEIDDIDSIFGGAVEFDDETSVRGRLGLRLGHEQMGANGILYTGDVTASVWQEFAGDNDVTIFAPLTPATGVSDDPGETFGDLSLGFTVVAPEGWSGFIRGNFMFNEDYESYSGNAGLRYSW